MVLSSLVPTRTTLSSASTQTAPGPFFETPALTTTFTPPSECTQGHLTMLESAQYQVWLNEPRPVANTTFSTCYPSQFMTSFLRSVSSTLVPAFSPLVCPDNYFTIFSQTITDRPLYIACCPSDYGFHPPDTSTPGRPGYGGTCYSDILKVSITQYDNSSSSGVMFFSTSGQAYAHPLDGFAVEATSTKSQPGSSSVTSLTATSLTATPVANAAASASSGVALDGHKSDSGTNTGLIAGLVVGLGLGALLIVAAAFFLIRSRKRKHNGSNTSGNGPTGAAWAHGKDVNELPSPPLKVNAPPVMRMRSELSDNSDPSQNQPPTYFNQPPTYHEMSTENLGHSNYPPPPPPPQR